MAERPSTSDGPRAPPSPGANQFRFDNKNYNKRISRDDSFLNTRQHQHSGFDFRPYGNARAQKSTTTITNTTTSTAPDLSPRSTLAPTSAAIPSIRMPTLEEGGEIGMALGSPGHASWQTGSSHSALKTKQAVPAASPGAQVARPSEAPAPKKQPGKWKLFGMFGRKHSEPAHANAEPKETRSSPQSEQKTATAAPPSRSPTKLERSLTSSSRKMPKYRPLVSRNNAAPPFPEGVGMEDQPWMKDRQPRPTEGEKSAGSNASAAEAGAPSATNGPMLNVAIPTVELERYSVMFSSVLGQGSKQSSSNLLARRQAALQELRSIDDAKLHDQDLKQPQPQIFRRATSPQPEISPSYDQFPSPPVSQESQQSRRMPHRLAPTAGRLARSNTSPAMLHSPLRPAFDSATATTPAPLQEEPSPKPPASSSSSSSYNHLRDPVKGNEPRAKLTIATLAKARETREAQGNSGVGPLSPPKSFRFDPEASSLVLDSSTDDGEDGGGVGGGGSQAPKPPSTASSSSASSSRKGSPSLSSSLAARTATPQTQPDLDADADLDSPKGGSRADAVRPRRNNKDECDSDPDKDDDDDAEVLITEDMSPVEASIARQISVSRQQRRMLRPLHQHQHHGHHHNNQQQRKNGTGGNAAMKEGPALALGPVPTKKMSVKKSTPVAVAVAAGVGDGATLSVGIADTRTATPTLVVPGAGPGDDRLPRNRRSERVVLEAA